MQDYIIVGNSPYFPAREFIVTACKNKIIVALDGAADQLKTLDILPNIILGDFDSIKDLNFWGITKTFPQLSNDDKPYAGKHGILIVPAKDQLHTDLSKAIKYCDNKGARSINIIGASFGRMDQHEGAVRTLRVFYRKERPIWFHTETETICFVKDDMMIIRGQIGDKCGIVAAPQGKVTTKGLVYEAHDFPLEFGYSENICNEFARESAEISIQGEALVVMPSVFREF